MKHLWTPWRREYVGDKNTGEQQDACIFCSFAGQPENDISSNVIARSKHTYAMLNRYPYTYGHTMIIPRKTCRFVRAPAI